MGSDAGGSIRPLRHGEAWTEVEFQFIVQCLTAGWDVEQIAARLQRTTTTVSSQLRRLVPRDMKIKARDREAWLRQELIRSPGYDWRAVLRSHADSDESVIWMQAEDDQLRAGWDRRTALPDLAQRLRLSESTIATRLIVLGLADDIAMVVARLGASPGGNVEARARVVRGQQAEAVYVVVLETDARPAVTLHHSREQAEAYLRETVGDLTQAEPRWWVLRRVLNGRDTGQSWTNASARLHMQLPSQRTDQDATPFRQSA